MLTRRLLPAAALLGLAACVPPQQPQVIYQQVPQASASCDTSFRVINNSSAVVERVFFSHSTQNGWGNDQLGQAVLTPGRSQGFRAANTGSYDFRVVWANGRAAELRGVNICAASNIVISNGGLSAS